MAILFDLDGTLVDTAVDIIQAINNLCCELNQPLADPILLRNNTSFGLNKLLETALNLNLQEIENQELQKFRARFKVLYNQTEFINSKLFPGILELLENLKQQQLKLAIVTNKNSEFAEPILEQVGIKHYFDCIITADMVHHPKPAPDPVLLAIDKLGVRSEECLFIGDAEQDIIAGKLAKVKTAAALFGYIGENVFTSSWNADYFVKQPKELWPLIKQLYFK